MSSGLLNASLQCQLLHIPLLKSLFLALFPIHVCLLISKLAEFPYKGLLLLLSCLFASVTLHTHFLSHSFSDAVLLFLSPLASLTLAYFLSQNSFPHLYFFESTLPSSYSFTPVLLLILATAASLCVSFHFNCEKNLFFFYLIFILYWNIVDLQCCVSFRCAAKWFSYTYTYIHSFSDSFPI